MYNTIYPIKVNPYQHQQNKNIRGGEQDDAVNPDEHEKNQQQYRHNYPSQKFPNGEKTTIDYSQSTINISQVITDFKNTTVAIAAPKNVMEEVDGYFNLIEKQLINDEPNEKIIKSNLKNASQILDTYITETLNKPSKVVENWIDALFLQKIDYKVNPDKINEAFKVKIPDDAPVNKFLQTQNDNSQNQDSYVSKPNGVYVPEDEILKKMFIKAKKYANIKQPQKAIFSFETALNRADEINDAQAKSMIYYEIGQIYNKNMAIPDALINYKKCVDLTSNNTLKARAHYSIGKIYDENIEFDFAMNHYFDSMSFAGEEENVNIQTKVLSNIGEMYADKYDKKTTLEYFNLAQKYAVETNDKKIIGLIYSKSADACTKLNEKILALDFYKSSTKNYVEIDENKKIIKNYQKASEIMEEYGNSQKAKKLLKRAYSIAIETKNEKKAKELEKLLD